MLDPSPRMKSTTYKVVLRYTINSKSQYFENIFTSGKKHCCIVGLYELDQKTAHFKTYMHLAGSQAAKSLLTKRKMFLENSELAPKLQQKKSPSNSEIVDFDHKPFLTMYKALLCQDGSSLILTCSVH